MTEVTIIDIGLGNVGSMINMVRKAGGNARAATDPNEIAGARKLIFPGVGHFGRAMEILNATGIAAAMSEAVIERKTPILGVCLGMQLFSRHSEEGDVQGLGWLDATTVRLQPGTPGLKVPHMGWNGVAAAKADPLLDLMSADARFYFVHSFHVVCADERVVLGRTSHGVPFTSAVQHANIWGVQFHPEKSHRYGLGLVRNFVENVAPC